MNAIVKKLIESETMQERAQSLVNMVKSIKLPDWVIVKTAVSDVVDNRGNKEILVDVLLGSNGPLHPETPMIAISVIIKEYGSYVISVWKHYGNRKAFCKRIHADVKDWVARDSGKEKLTTTEQVVAAVNGNTYLEGEIAHLVAKSGRTPKVDVSAYILNGETYIKVSLNYKPLNTAVILYMWDKSYGVSRVGQTDTAEHDIDDDLIFEIGDIISEYLYRDVPKQYDPFDL